MSDRVLEIELDGAKNENVSFFPLQRTLRGRFEWIRVKDAAAAQKVAEWGAAIPGQRLAIDLDTGEAQIREPLWDREHLLARMCVEKHKFELPAPEEKVESAHKPTWLYWMKRLCNDGLAKVTRGVLPDRIEGEPKLKTFYLYDPAKQGATVNVAAQQKIIDQQGTQISQLMEAVAKLTGALTAEARAPQGGQQAKR